MSNNEDTAKDEMAKIPKQFKLSIDINSPTPNQCILDKDAKGYVLKDKPHITQWVGTSKSIGSPSSSTNNAACHGVKINEILSILPGPRLLES